MGQKSKVRICIHACEYRRKLIFSSVLGTGKTLAGLWQAMSGVTAMNFKKQKNCHSPCALVRVVSLMLLPSAHLDNSLLSTLVSLTLITLEGESGCVTHGCWFYTREKVDKVNIAGRSGTLFVETLNIELQLDLILQGG